MKCLNTYSYTVYLNIEMYMILICKQHYLLKIQTFFYYSKLSKVYEMGDIINELF